MVRRASMAHPRQVRSARVAQKNWSPVSSTDLGPVQVGTVRVMRTSQRRMRPCAGTRGDSGDRSRLAI